jgi:hypothetical protein
MASAGTTSPFQSQIDALNATLQSLLETPRILSAADTQSIQAALAQYQALNASLASAIGTTSSNTDIGKITTNIGQYQTQIKALQQQLKEVKEESETSEARKRSVENTEQDVSYHQLYLIDRPLRQLSIPTLFTLSVIFIMGGIYFLYKLNVNPATATATTPVTTSGFTSPLKGLTGIFSGPTTVTQPAPAPTAGLFSTLFKNTPKLNVGGKGLSEYFK